ncbi:MAG: hypothetical protein CFE38_08520 [Comamonadaceae bacterium PBBC1]|nr:MAG: hypothetical protein CFE38_08520 [Comamonadaceae bacterium PBBC1]
MESLLSASSSSSSSSSDKLSSGWVNQARDAASSMRRSVAGQIGHWATLGRLAQAWAKKVQPAKPRTPWVAQFWLGVRSARGWRGRCCGLRGRHVHPVAALAQRPMQP